MALTDEDKVWLESKINIRFHELSEKIERVETSLLTEFHKWASPVDARLKTHTAMLRVVDVEMEALADRVKHLENRASN